MAQFKRRAYLVHPLQLRLIVLNAVYFLSGIAVSWAFVVGPLIARMNDVGRAAGDREADADVLLFLHERLLIALLPGLILVSFHALRVSHRIAGPLVRFRSILRSLSHGDLTVNTKLRRRDLLHEDAARFDDLIDSLTGRVARLRRACASVREAGEALDGERLLRGVEALESELASFRTREPEVAPLREGADEASERPTGNAAAA